MQTDFGEKSKLGASGQDRVSFCFSVALPLKAALIAAGSLSGQRNKGHQIIRGKKPEMKNTKKWNP